MRRSDFLKLWCNVHNSYNAGGVLCSQCCNRAHRIHTICKHGLHISLNSGALLLQSLPAIVNAVLIKFSSRFPALIFLSDKKVVPPNPPLCLINCIFADIIPGLLFLRASLLYAHTILFDASFTSSQCKECTDHCDSADSGTCQFSFTFSLVIPPIAMTGIFTASQIAFSVSCSTSLASSLSLLQRRPPHPCNLLRVFPQAKPVLRSVPNTPMILSGPSFARTSPASYHFDLRELHLPRSLSAAISHIIIDHKGTIFFTECFQLLCSSRNFSGSRSFSRICTKVTPPESPLLPDPPGVFRLTSDGLSLHIIINLFYRTSYFAPSSKVF